MVNNLTKNNKNKKNVTKKLINVKKITPAQKAIICKNSANTYDTFEDKIEKVFKDKKINIISTTFNLEKQILTDLKKAVNPTGIQPNQDYYSFINERWMKEFEISKQQEYLVQVDDFRLVQDKVYRELIQIIENYISDPSVKNTKKCICISNAYESLKIYNTVQQTRCLTTKLLEYIDEVFKFKENVWELLGVVNKNEIISWAAPFVWSLNPDYKNPKVYKCYL